MKVDRGSGIEAHAGADRKQGIKFAWPTRKLTKNILTICDNGGRVNTAMVIAAGLVRWKSSCK